MSHSEWVARGNIISVAGDDCLPGRYLSNGRFGAVMSRYGLNAQPEAQRTNEQDCRSQYMHMGHAGRFRFFSDATKTQTTADYILPLFRLHWDKEPTSVRDYRQCQNLYDGTLLTDFTLPSGAHVSVTNWFDQVNKDLAGVLIDLSEEALDVRLSVIREFIPYTFVSRNTAAQSVQWERIDGGMKIGIACEDTLNHASSTVFLHTDAAIEQQGPDLMIRLQKGCNRIFLSYGVPTEKGETDQSLARTIASWHALWDTGGCMCFSDDRMQKTFVRSLFYLLATYGDDYGAIQPTNGLTGNIFPFHFVQDLEYIAPALMMTGHADIVRRWVERFADEIEPMRRYAKRLWADAEGIYPPWELPYGDIDGYHSPGVPVAYCYEPHNVGYLCRLAAEAADFAGDEAWTKKYADPLIRECSAFYFAACRRGDDRKWHMRWLPSIGQDEAGGRNQSDYLCSLYSAKYCFLASVRHGLDENGVYRRVLDDGLAFDGLMSQDGVLHTALLADDRGKQKHPVQLDGLAFMPTEREPFAYEKQAYLMRRELTAEAKAPFYYGWTLGEFLLAGSNLGDDKNWMLDFIDMRASDMTDPEWVQIYETSGATEKSFYTTTHGMVLQSLIRNYVNDYWGRLDLAACPVGHGASFDGIRTRFHVTVSGAVQDGKCECDLNAERDCAVQIGKEQLSLKKGEVCHRAFDTNRSGAS